MKAKKMILLIIAGTFLGNVITAMFIAGIERDIRLAFTLSACVATLIFGALLSEIISLRLELRRQRRDREDRFQRINEPNDDFESSDWPSPDDAEEHSTPRRRRMHS